MGSHNPTPLATILEVGIFLRAYVKYKQQLLSVSFHSECFVIALAAVSNLYFEPVDDNIIMF